MDLVLEIINSKINDAERWNCSSGKKWMALGNNHLSAILTEIFKYVRIHPNFASQPVWFEKMFLCFSLKAGRKDLKNRSKVLPFLDSDRNQLLVVGFATILYVLVGIIAPQTCRFHPSPWSMAFRSRSGGLCEFARVDNLPAFPFHWQNEAACRPK